MVEMCAMSKEKKKGTYQLWGPAWLFGVCPVVDYRRASFIQRTYKILVSLEHIID
jgi:hypothetical protein